MARPKCFFNRARAVFDRRLIAFKRLRIFRRFRAVFAVLRLFDQSMRMGSVPADSPFRCFSPIGEDASFPKRACHHKCACFHAPCGDISDPVFPSSERCFSACCDDMSSSGSVLTDMVLPSVRPACPCGCAGCFRTACVEFAAYSRMGKIASPTAFLRRSYQLRN